jgi:hypothetical protein
MYVAPRIVASFDESVALTEALGQSCSVHCV